MQMSVSRLWQTVLNIIPPSQLSTRIPCLQLWGHEEGELTSPCTIVHQGVGGLSTSGGGGGARYSPPASPPPSKFLPRLTPRALEVTRTQNSAGFFGSVGFRKFMFFFPCIW